ncbi:MAG: GHMP kinase [Chloroflexota bacterium]|nr:GHMP kinase [Chloroflexota bacterium]
MIIVSRAPVRISLGGGGTDLPSYYERYDGLVVSAAIDYYVYAILSPAKDGPLQIISADYRTMVQRPICEDLIWDGDLSLPKAVIYHFNVRDGVTVFLASQVPPGTGLGSSGSVAVSMIKALAFWCGLDLGPAEVAELACYIEIGKMGMPVGKQDQYAAAFGGLNCITFAKDDVSVEPLNLPLNTIQSLQSRLMLFFTGTSHISSTILRQHRNASQQGEPAVVKRLHTIKELGLATKAALEQGHLQEFGDLLHQSWLNKRELSSNVTNSLIDKSYSTALEHGAVGGQIMGAGGGGFLLLYCPEERQDAVTRALENLGLQRRDFAFDMEGMQVMQAVPWQRAPYSLERHMFSDTKPGRAWVSA